MIMRVGFFTGKVYTDEDYPLRRINECALMLSDSSKVKDDKYMEDLRSRLRGNCNKCSGDPDCAKNRKITH